GPARDVVRLFGPRPWRTIDLGREYGGTRGNRDFEDAVELAFEPATQQRTVHGLVIQTDRRGNRLRHPIKSNVGEQTIFAEAASDIATAVAPGAELLHDPSGEPRGRIIQPVAEGLRLGSLDLHVAGLFPLELIEALGERALRFRQTRRIGALRSCRDQHVE